MKSQLAQVAMALGGVIGIVNLPWLVLPAQARRFWLAVPRHVWLGRLLAAGAVLWCAWLVRDIELGRFEPLKQWLAFIACGAYMAIIVFMDELLAVRALGGLLLLVPAPILAVARLHDSPWRLVVVTLCYLMAIKGMIYVLSPYKLRVWVERYAGADGHARILGAAGLLVGLFVLVLGVAVF